jgi:hypothetical protein
MPFWLSVWGWNGIYTKTSDNDDENLSPIYYLPSRSINLFFTFIIFKAITLFKLDGKWVMRQDGQNKEDIEKFEDQSTPVGKWVDYNRGIISIMVKPKEERTLRWFVNDFLRASTVLHWTEICLFLSFVAMTCHYRPDDDAVLTEICFTMMGMILGTSIHFVISYVTLLKNISD